jgi:hypothetical protein
LAFAATGHPPYQGDTVMDVLARLATEEPDLSGLPGELTELIAACLQRVPRDRPTSSAMLAQLGQFTETRPGAAGEHSYLPDAAMALIAQYQRNPLLASGQPLQEDSGGDATSASYTELPASYQPRKSPRQPTGWRRWVKAHLAWVGWVSVGAALVVGGVILGASLSSSGSPSVPQGLPPAPPTVCGTFQAPPGPSLCMVKQSEGTPSTAFVVEGHDFAPGSPVTFMLSGIGPPPEQKNLLHLTSPLTVVVGPAGTFRVSVSQIYSGVLQLGQFTLVANTSNSTADTDFIVIPSEPPPGAAPTAP